MPAGDETDLDDLFAETPDQTEPLAADASAADDFAAPTADEFAAASEGEDKLSQTATTPTQPERPRGPKKPWWDIYTSMLAVTLLAIILGCVFLVMEWKRYNFETTPTAIPSAAGN
jgi:hypothetical protein